MPAYPRPLTHRERAVLDALLVDGVRGVAGLRAQAATAEVVGGCDCGCPSVDFHREPGVGMSIVVNAAVRGTDDGVFLFTVGGRLGGLEWVGVGDDDPTELPSPDLLEVEPAR